ncbi:MAG: hypothetical protein CL677_05395 [Bdellovibrionaceae bacterium]|nr:hypothetical protein [Pseudobdellovibrionaceae bacterium]|tara:strand:- start:122427 stop:123407 length:981 start_codon:yes stop_codon:yes gene_type:complete
MKFVVYILLLVFSGACSHNGVRETRPYIEASCVMQIERNLSSARGVPRSCRALFSSKIHLHREAIDALNREQESLSLQLEQARSLEQHNKAISSQLDKYFDEGRSIYLGKGEREFKSQLEIIEGSSGKTRAAIFKATLGGENLIIKQLNAIKNDLDVLREVQNARFMELLGIGPKVHLVKIQNARYLVMEELPGINIKEVLFLEGRSSTTQSQIEHMLKITAPSLQVALNLFAKEFMADPAYEIKLREIQNLLLEHGFKNVEDFQFMVDLNIGPESIKIIDVEAYRREMDSPLNKNSEPIWNTPEVLISNYLKRLERIAADESFPY